MVLPAAGTKGVVPGGGFCTGAGALDVTGAAAGGCGIGQSVTCLNLSL